MELTRSQQQYILDVLAELCGEQYGLDLKFTLKEKENGQQENETQKGA